MNPYHMPWRWPLLLLFAALLVLVFALFWLQVIGAAFVRIGVHPLLTPMILLASLVGAGMNIRIWETRVEPRETPSVVRFMGVSYRVPRIGSDRVVVAVNVGGALIPLIMSSVLFSKIGDPLRVLLATGVVAAVCFVLARPVPGVGIVLPVFVPAVVAALSAMVLAGRAGAPAVAYVAGTVGTLVGADILHLKDLPKLGSTILSIGGAGTFDGVFLAGVLAALLA